MTEPPSYFLTVGESNRITFGRPSVLSAGHAPFGTLNVFFLFRNWVVFEAPCWLFLSCWSKWPNAMPARHIQSSPRTGQSHWLQSLPGRESLHSGWISAAWLGVPTGVSFACFLSFSLSLHIQFASTVGVLCTGTCSGIACSVESWWHFLATQCDVGCMGRGIVLNTTDFAAFYCHRKSGEK